MKSITIRFASAVMSVMLLSGLIHCQGASAEETAVSEPSAEQFQETESSETTPAETTSATTT